MSNSSIQLSRALALGWRESDKFAKFSKQNHQFGILLESFDEMESFSKIVNALYDQELLNFKVKINNNGNEQFEAWREGIHDDLVLSVALSSWYLQYYFKNQFIIPNPVSINKFKRF